MTPKNQIHATVTTQVYERIFLGYSSSSRSSLLIRFITRGINVVVDDESAYALC